MEERIFMPNIMTETRYGLSEHAIQDEMFKRREIMLEGEMTNGSCCSVIMQLLELQEQDPDGEITMYVQSPGGDVVAGLAVYDCMQAISCPIRTVCLNASSMASIIVASGTPGKREIFEHSSIMVHQPFTQNVSGNYDEVKSRGNLLQHHHQTLIQILAEHTGHSEKEIEKLCDNGDRTLFAEEAVKWGLVDKVITSIDCNSENSDSEERGD